MSNFTVSARKYRPGVFETVIGQDHVTQTLRNAIKNDHLGQAFLFCGPRGVGKTTCARILAKALNCENLSTEGEPCGTCSSCQAFATQTSFNIYELDAASNNSVDDIRSLVEQVRFAPQHGKYKIYIIDEVHMLSPAAFNAFLKTLEEPPSYAIFILATTEKHKILPTILSRCQLFEFHRLGVKQIISQLRTVCEKEGLEAEEEALYVIAQKADGAMRDALSIFDRIVSFSGDKITYKDVIENLNQLDYEYYFKIIDLVLEEKLSETLLLFDEILTKGFDAHNFLNGLSSHLRDLMISKDASTIRLMEVSEGVQQRYYEQSKRSSMSFLLSALNMLNQFDVTFKSSKNGRLHIELALMKLCHLQDAIQFAGNGQPAQEKKKPEPGINTAAASSNNTIAAGISAATAAPKASASNTINAAKLSMNMDKLREEAIASRLKPAPQPAEAEETQTIYEQANIDKFKVAWKGYVANLRERGKSSLAAMADKCEPNSNENGIIHVRLENDSLKTQFIDDKLSFNDFLNTVHGISNIRVEFVVVPPSNNEVKQYLVSDRDKFNRMYEKNPAVKDLQERLGLKVE